MLSQLSGLLRHCFQLLSGFDGMSIGGKRMDVANKVFKEEMIPSLVVFF